jgi:MSHA pilin protein MshC
MRIARGFTLVELVAIIVVLGILSISVVSKFSTTGSFAERTVRDRIVAIARYAQQRAMYDQNPAHCYRLQINATDYGAQRDRNDGNGFQYFGPPSSATPRLPDDPAGTRILIEQNVNLLPAAIDIYFDGLGNPFDSCNLATRNPIAPTITITGADITQQVFVEGTGYVHW